MNKRNKTTLITNFLLIAIFLFVAISGFMPEKILPMSGESTTSAIYSGNKENPNVSIMINVYENTDIVLKMMEVLKSKNVTATFFVGGCWADDNEKALNEMVKNGFEIGNHGYFHKDHAKLSYEKNVEEISFTEKIVNALCGYKTTLFAPPSGSFSNNTLNACCDLEYDVIMWSKDTIDWRDSDKKVIYSRATKNPTNGDLILMHPKTHTLEILPDVIDFYLNKGFNLVDVSKNIK